VPVREGAWVGTRAVLVVRVIVVVLFMGAGLSDLDDEVGCGGCCCCGGGGRLDGWRRGC